MEDETSYFWGAATTLPRAEVIAAESVAVAGYQVWLPQYRRRRVLKGARIENGRKIRSRSDSISFEMVPLFRGYLFVQVPHGDGGYLIEKSHGVSRLLRTPNTEEAWGKVKIIRARFILQLQEWVAKGLYEDEHGRIVETYTPRSDLEIGDTVRTPVGIVGTLRSLDERGRADLMAEMLGASRPIYDVDADTLEKISA